MQTKKAPRPAAVGGAEGASGCRLLTRAALHIIVHEQASPRTATARCSHLERSSGVRGLVLCYQAEARSRDRRPGGRPRRQACWQAKRLFANTYIPRRMRLRTTKTVSRQIKGSAQVSATYRRTWLVHATHSSRQFYSMLSTTAGGTGQQVIELNSPRQALPQRGSPFHPRYPS